MYALLKPLLFSIEPARAHALAMSALGTMERAAPLRLLLGRALSHRDPRLEVRKMDLVFPSPIGLAAGFDKDAKRVRALAALGFGHLELGTVTAEPQGPNPAPNLFRLPADEALVNRLGFPNEGAERVARRVLALRGDARLPPVGISIGKSRSVPLAPLDGALADYVASFEAVRGAADFIVVNISSPNTKDLRALQAADMARELFAALMRAPAAPLLVKIAPDLSDDDVDAICVEADRAGLAGVVATNTTTSRTGLVTSTADIERVGAGGLSGRPLFSRALAVVKRARARLGPSACVIGVGGVDGTERALAMLRAGADLVQLYTSFIYEGPLLPRRIARELSRRMDAEGARALVDLVSSQSGVLR